MAYIYILINHSIVNPDTKEELVKIGWTDKTPEKRADELSKLTGVAAPFEVYAAYETPAIENDGDKELHKMINELTAYEYHYNKEFFTMKPKEAYRILEHIASISGTKDKLIKPKENKTKEKTKKNRITYSMKDIGVPKGAKLLYKNDETKVCTVENDEAKSGKILIYNDIEYSFKELASHFCGYEYKQNARDEFTYEGKAISEIFNERIKE